MTRILHFSGSEVLRTTRDLVLEKQGYTVRSFAHVSDFSRMGYGEQFDLGIIGHTFRGEEKRQIALRINHRFPGIPILELCFHSPEVPGADFILSDSPAELLAAVHDILSGRRVRGFVEKGC